MNNVFNFATSELSQDALLCYWFNFATEEHLNESIEERESAQKLLSLIIKEWTGDSIEYKNIQVNKIVRQFNKIDILLLVNDNYFILIEDKIYTSEHSDQINKYIKSLEEPIENTKNHLISKFNTMPEKKKIIPVYFKMIDQSDYELNKYCFINRKKVLEIINQYNYSELSLLKMFKEYVLNIEHEYKCYDNYQVSDWTYNNYFGYFSSLHKAYNYKAYTDYLNNRGGGFFANWFNFEPINIDNATDVFIMLSGPKKGEHDFTLEYRISYNPLEITDSEEKILFNHIEEIRTLICSKLNTFDRKDCPRKIPVSHKKEKSTDYKVIDDKTKEKELKTDRPESVRLAKSTVNKNEIKERIKDCNMLINQIIAQFS